MGKIVPVKVGNFIESIVGNSRILYQIIAINQPCPYCHGNDAVKLNVPANNDEGQDVSTGEYAIIDNKVGYKITSCVQILYAEARDGRANSFFMIPESLNADINKRLLWDNSEEAEPV